MILARIRRFPACTSCGALAALRPNLPAEAGGISGSGCGITPTETGERAGHDRANGSPAAPDAARNGAAP